MIGMAFLASGLGTVMQAGMTILGAMNGPVFGIFLVAIGMPKVGKLGAWAGLIISSVILHKTTINILKI